MMSIDFERGDFLGRLIEAANENDPIDLTHIETSRWLRDLDAELVGVLWRSRGEVRHYLVKRTMLLAGATVSMTAFWLTNLPDSNGFKIVDTPHGPTIEVFGERQRPDGKLEVIGPTGCVDCGMKTGIRGEWYLVHDHVWRQAWPGNENWLDGCDENSAKYFLEEILCVSCLEKRLGRQLTPADFPKGWDSLPVYMSKRLRNRVYGA